MLLHKKEHMPMEKFEEQVLRHDLLSEIANTNTSNSIVEGLFSTISKMIPTKQTISTETQALAKKNHYQD